MTLNSGSQTARVLLRAVRELAYIQDVENCHSGLCKTSEGKSIVNDGMDVLGLHDLSDEAIGECCSRLQQPPAPRISAENFYHVIFGRPFILPSTSPQVFAFAETYASYCESSAHCAAAQPAQDEMTMEQVLAAQPSGEQAGEERLREALRAALKLPRPWMDGGITYEEWDAAFSTIESLLAGTEKENKNGE